MSSYSTQGQGVCYKKSKVKEHGAVCWGIHKKETRRKPRQGNRKASSSLLLFGAGIRAVELDGERAMGPWFPRGNELINARSHSSTEASVLPGNFMFSGFLVLNKENFQSVRVYSNL